MGTIAHHVITWYEFTRIWAESLQYLNSWSLTLTIGFQAELAPQTVYSIVARHYSSCSLHSMDDREEIAEEAAYIAMMAYDSYQTTGYVAYINSATDMARIAAATIPDGHHSRAGFLNNLAVMLNVQY